MDTGNAKALREALVMARYNILPLPPHWEKTSCQCKECRDRREAFRVVDEALAAPPRNCDVGTAEEQKERFEKFCESQPTVNCDGCHLAMNYACEFEWAQMPYEPQKKG